MAGRRILYLLSLGGGVIFYCFYREWLSWFLLMILLGLPWFSLFCSLPAMLKSAYNVQCYSNPSDRQPCAKLTVKCPLPAPPCRGKLRITHAITGESWTMPLNRCLPATVCGKMTVAVHRLRVYDYLGLFCLPIKHCKPANIILFPTPVMMDNIPDAAPYAPQHSGRSSLSEHYELRPYRPGDHAQGIHWKLSAKTGSLIFREAAAPMRHRIVLTMELQGTHKILNHKLGQLLWLGNRLTEKQQPFEVSVLTGHGVLVRQIHSAESWNDAMTELLSCPQATAGFPGIRQNFRHEHQIHIGGKADGN